LHKLFPVAFSVSFLFLHNMNKEARVWTLRQWLEVSIDGVLGLGSEGLFDHGSEVVQSVGIVGESDQQIYSYFLSASIILPELVAVLVLLVYIHEIIQGDKIGFVVHVEDAGLDVLDVAAVVVDVVGWGLPIG